MQTKSLNSSLYLFCHFVVDVFEYLSPEEELALRNEIAANMKENSRMVYWNFLVDRFQTVEPFKLQEEESRHLSLKDKVFFYSRLFVEEKRKC